MSTKTPEMFSREAPVISIDTVVADAELAEKSKTHSVRVETTINTGDSIPMVGSHEAKDRLGVFTVGEGDGAKPFELVSLDGKDIVIDPADPTKATVEVDGITHEISPDSSLLIIGLDASSTPDKPVKFGLGIRDGATKIRSVDDSGRPTTFGRRFGVDASVGDIVDLTVDSGEVIANAHTKLEVVTHREEDPSEHAERVRTAGEEAGKLVIEEALGMLDGTRRVMRTNKKDARAAFLREQATIRESDRPALEVKLTGAAASLEGAQTVLSQAKEQAGRRHRKQEAGTIKEKLDEAVRQRAEADRAAGKIVSNRSVSKQLKGTKAVARRMARVQAANRLNTARTGLTEARSSYDTAQNDVLANSSESSRGGRGTRLEARRAVKELTHEERAELLNTNTTNERRREIVTKGQGVVASTGIRQRSYNAVSGFDANVRRLEDWSSLATTRTGERYHTSRGRASRRQRNAATRSKSATKKP